MISCVVPCGSPQNTASSLVQSTSSHFTSCGRSSMKKCGKTSPIALPAWVFAVSADDLNIRMPRQQPHRIGTGVTGGAENADFLLRAHRMFLLLPARPSISRMFCTAAPEAPLPRLSSRATSTAWWCLSLANT